MTASDPTRPSEAAVAPAETPPAKAPAPAETAPPKAPAPSGRAAVVLFVIVAAISALSLWYLFQTQPLVVQGEADATRIDIAARVDGLVLQRPVERSDNVAAGQLLLVIDNPELVAQLNEARTAKAAAEANLANVLAGVREEEIAQRQATVAASEANLALAQQEYNRTKQLSEHDFASLQKLQQETASLDVAKSTLVQARAAHDEAVAGATREQRAVAQAGVVRADASIRTLEAQVAELRVKAPIAAQVYQIGSELGEYVSPGVPLLSLVDLGDVWFRFDLREDLARDLEVGDTFSVRVPALADRLVAVKVRTIAPRGEYAGWRATRATGDFDLRTFEVRAYPTEPLPALRPGMSAYVEWKGGER
jgi:HlyD family secretion protein